MAQYLPPLAAIRAFEAASRHLSVTKAAVELNVTTAAVSHQIKMLEEHFGKPLFNRSNRRITLTEAGVVYAGYVQQAFQHLQEGTQQLKTHSNTDIALTVEPAFAIYWLIPNLTDFQQKHPDIQIKISTGYDVADLNANSFDLAIRWGRGDYPGLHSDLLIRNTIIPVCSPQLLKGKHALKQPNDLQYTYLLYESQTDKFPDYPYWKRWLKKAKYTHDKALKKRTFAQGFMLIQSAIAGQGVALERKLFVKPALAQGTLVQPFNISLKETITGYHLVCQKQSLQNKSIITFIEWLKTNIR